MVTKASMLSNGGVGKRLLNVKETAVFLGCKVDTVYKKARLRSFPRSRWVGRWVRCSSLRALHRTAHDRNHRLKGVRRECLFTK